MENVEVAGAAAQAEDLPAAELEVKGPFRSAAPPGADEAERLQENWRVYVSYAEAYRAGGIE
jgi:hypothetical protein